MKRNITEMTDLSRKELIQLINRCMFFSKNKNKKFSIIENKKVGLLFDAASLRTRLSFEVATYNLGGFPHYIPVQSVTHELDGTPREIFEDIIDTMDRFIDVYVVRDYSRKIYQILLKKNNPPIINGFCKIGHPSQALADLCVIISKKKNIENLEICAICPETGSGVIESFVYGVLLLNGRVTLITPTGKFKGKNKDFSNKIKKLPGILNIIKEPEDIIDKADVLYVDEWWENHPDFLQNKPPKKYQVNTNFLKKSKKNLIILHCLPAHHDREISKKVIYSKKSIVFDQAEFRVYSAMSLLEFVIKS